MIDPKFRGVDSNVSWAKIMRLDNYGIEVTIL